MRAVLRERLRKRLVQRRRDLIAAFRRNQDTRAAADDGPLDLADTASELYTQEFNYSLSENERAELTLIDEALQRIEDGYYGECDECGNKISDARLRAIPWAPRCLDCQEEIEQTALRA